MSEEVHPLNKRTWSGDVGCTACGHVWGVQAQVGQHQFHCPSCDAKTGRWIESVLPPPHAEVWGCTCGCIAFTLTIEGYYCMNCGLVQPKEIVRFTTN